MSFYWTECIATIGIIVLAIIAWRALAQHAATERAARVNAAQRATRIQNERVIEHADGSITIGPPPGTEHAPNPAPPYGPKTVVDPEETKP